MSPPGSGYTEEFTLDESAAPGATALPRATGGRRSMRAWRRYPGPWVALAALLVIVGTAASPLGERPEPRPPQTAWSNSAFTPGRAPGVWLLQDRPVVAAADGLTALDPVTGEPVWTLALDDPACTAADHQLTCVHGEGESAGIVTVGADGAATERPFPGADVAATIGTDLVVGGGLDVYPWIGRFTLTDENVPEQMWRYQPLYPLDRAERWTGVTISQGTATVFTTAATSSGAPALDLAAELETGEGRSAVVQRLGGIAVSNVGRTSAEWHQQAPPMAGAAPEVPGHPDIVFTMSGARDRGTGEVVLAYTGLPLLALGDDLIYSGTPPGRPAALTAPDQIAVRLERVDVLTGESRWQLERNSYLACPCAVSGETLALVAATFAPGDAFTAVPHAVLGVDPETGRHHWSLPISTAPDGIAAGPGHVYLFTGGTLTAYSDR